MEVLETKTNTQIEYLNRSTENHVEEISVKLDEQKEETNDLSIKNSRLWAKEQIRLEHDKLMQSRKSKDNENEREQCANEVTEGTLFSQLWKYPTRLKRKKIPHVLIPIAMNC